MRAHALRQDAERNRRRLVDTARIVFAQQGLDAPLNAIAREAGIGNATLYRHFPTRDHLIAAVFEDMLRELLDVSERALAEPDAWTGFTSFLSFLTELPARDRALADLLIRPGACASELGSLRSSIFANMNRLIDGAKRQGHLRRGFHHQDVRFILMASAGISERGEEQAPVAWRRHFGYVLDGLRTPGHTPDA
jgi:AcrR family transcriptional regulator